MAKHLRCADVGAAAGSLAVVADRAACCNLRVAVVVALHVLLLHRRPAKKDPSSHLMKRCYCRTVGCDDYYYCIAADAGIVDDGSPSYRCCCCYC